VASSEEVSHELGKRVSHHPWRARFDTTIAPVTFGAIFVAIAVLMFAVGDAMIMLGIAAVALAGVMVERAITNLRDRHDVIDIYERGVVVGRRGTIYTWTWRELQLQFDAVRELGAAARVFHRHRLACGDVTVPVDGDFADIDILVRALDEGILDHQLDATARAIADGESRVFGAITVTKDGIDSALVAMSWGQIASVDVRWGRVAIRRLGDGLVIAFDYAAIWNAALVLVLVRLGLAGAFTQSGPLRTSDLRRQIADVLADRQRLGPRRR
jgi:uncharacterized protein DUF6585